MCINYTEVNVHDGTRRSILFDGQPLQIFHSGAAERLYLV